MLFFRAPNSSTDAAATQLADYESGFRGESAQFPQEFRTVQLSSSSAWFRRTQ